MPSPAAPTNETTPVTLSSFRPRSLSRRCFSTAHDPGTWSPADSTARLSPRLVPGHEDFVHNNLTISSLISVLAQGQAQAKVRQPQGCASFLHSVFNDRSPASGVIRTSTRNWPREDDRISQVRCRWFADLNSHPLPYLKLSSIGRCFT